MLHVGNVDAPRGDIRGNQHAHIPILEAANRAVALALALVAVDRSDGEALGRELFRQLLGPVLGAAEDDGPLVAMGVQKVDQAGDLLVLGDEMHRLHDAIDRAAGGRHLDPQRIAKEAGGEAFHLLGHRGREQHGAPFPRQGRGDAAKRVDEAQVEHLVGLVQHQLARLRQIDRAAFHQVHQAARRGHDEVGNRVPAVRPAR